MWAFENGIVRECEYEEFKNVIPSELIELVQEQHIGSEINNIDCDSNKIEHKEMNENQQKYQCQKCDEIEEIIFEIDGDHEDTHGDEIKSIFAFEYQNGFDNQSYTFRNGSY